MVKADVKILEASIHSAVLQQNSVFPKKVLNSEKKVYLVLHFIIYIFISMGWIFAFIAIDIDPQHWRDLKCCQRKG